MRMPTENHEVHHHQKIGHNWGSCRDDIFMRNILRHNQKRMVKSNVWDIPNVRVIIVQET